MPASTFVLWCRRCWQYTLAATIANNCSTLPAAVPGKRVKTSEREFINLLRKLGELEFGKDTPEDKQMNI